MSIRKLPQITNFAALEELEPRPNETAAKRFTPGLSISNLADDDAGATVLDIFGNLGKDPWTGEGIDTAMVADALRGAKNVVVNLNSPGGNFFQGTGIYNLLAQHPHNIKVNVLGLAASAASIVMLAGDQILMGPASFVMIHNASAVAMGDRHDFESVMETLSSIDSAIRDLYVTRTGKQANKISQMMDDETWMNARDAIANKFADGVIVREIAEDPAIKNQAAPMAAKREIDAILASAGKTRSQRRELIGAIKGDGYRIDNSAPGPDSGIAAIRDELRTLAKDSTPRAADDTTPRAGISETLSRLASKLG